MQKKSLVLLMMLLAVSSCSNREKEASEEKAVEADHQAVTEAQLASARQTVKSFGSQLKQALLQGLGEGGPSQALAVCQDLAPKIATGISDQTGWHVARTSLKTRNPGNTPDPWERKVLEQFETDRTEGKNPVDMEYYEIVVADGQRSLRYMKAIPTGRLCLQCHGSDLDPATSAKIEELYPEDRATRFAEGDIRGAFSLQRPL